MRFLRISVKCPIRVKRVGFVMSAVCPVYPQQQTSPDTVGTSHLCHLRKCKAGSAMPAHSYDRRLLELVERTAEHARRWLQRYQKGSDPSKSRAAFAKRRCATPSKAARRIRSRRADRRPEAGATREPSVLDIRTVPQLQFQRKVAGHATPKVDWNRAPRAVSTPSKPHQSSRARCHQISRSIVLEAEWPALPEASRNPRDPAGRPPGTLPDWCVRPARSSATCRSTCRTRIRSRLPRRATCFASASLWIGTGGRRVAKGAPWFGLTSSGR